MWRMVVSKPVRWWIVAWTLKWWHGGVLRYISTLKFYSPFQSWLPHISPQYKIQWTPIIPPITTRPSSRYAHLLVIKQNSELTHRQISTSLNNALNTFGPQSQQYQAILQILKDCLQKLDNDKERASRSVDPDMLSVAMGFLEIGKWNALMAASLHVPGSLHDYIYRANWSCWRSFDAVLSRPRTWMVFVGCLSMPIDSALREEIPVCRLLERVVIRYQSHGVQTQDLIICLRTMRILWENWVHNHHVGVYK